MTSAEPETIERVACIGAGTIGGGWAAEFLRAGLDVVAWDPAPDGEVRLKRAVEAAWPALEALGLAPGASPDRLHYAPSLAAAVGGVAFIQESAPERMEVKIAAIAEIDAATAPEAVISSSTSGFSMTDMQVGCAHPERTVVGHPFNPVYLVPLVEVVPGEKTDPAAAVWAKRLYDHVGKSAVIVKDRVYGFLANRLQVALWREALHMIAAGEATAEDLDRCISEGPGLRWAIMGPFLTFHLGGGEGGIADYLGKFGAEENSPYSRLEGPPLTDELRASIVEGCARLAAGRSVATLAAERDRCLVAIRRALASCRDS